jgi:hypothetical protein
MVLAVVVTAGCVGSGAAARIPAATDPSSTSPPPATTRFAPPVAATHYPRRPPQFIAVSFNGSGDAALWQHWRQVAQATGARFSFFLSGVYLLDPADRLLYHPPQHPAGSSDIGFSPNAAAVGALVRQINLGYREGNEIGTHYNGHFCAGYEPGSVDTWTAADWVREITQFRALVRHAGLTVPISSIVGGRTPCLQGNLGVLYRVLRAQGFRYDASHTDAPSQWPVRIHGIWSFPLALIKLVGTPWDSLSMDYNFYVNQSNAVDVPVARSKVLAQDAYLSYLRYFKQNYYGDRAPLDIGNHFATWNHWAYVHALTRFVERVCGKPEVRCVTYSTLAGWLDHAPPATLARYRRGAFPRLHR